MAHKVTSQGLSAQRTIDLLLLANKSDINEAGQWAVSLGAENRCNRPQSE